MSLNDPLHNFILCNVEILLTKIVLVKVRTKFYSVKDRKVLWINSLYLTSSRIIVKYGAKDFIKCIDESYKILEEKNIEANSLVLLLNLK